MEAISGHGLRNYDLVTLGNVLRVCDIDLVLLDDQPPTANITSFIHDQALLCTLQAGSHVRGRFLLPTDWCLLGCVHEVDGRQSWCHGVPMAPGGVFSVMPEGITEFALGAGTRMTFVLLPLARFQQRSSQATLTGDFDLASVPLLSDAPLAPLQRYYQGLSERIVQGEVEGEEISMMLDVHVRHVIANGTLARASCSRSRLSRYLIFRRAEDFMHANLRRHIYMHELYAAAGVSERALRYAFEEMVGISPVRYLSMLRLCEACRSLASSNAGRKSVKAIALSCGLWDLSRFADNYRRVFGELPRDTLMRSSHLQA